MLLKGVSLWLPGREEAGLEETATATHTPQESRSVCDPPPYSSRISCAKLLLELGEYSVSNACPHNPTNQIAQIQSHDCIRCDLYTVKIRNLVYTLPLAEGMWCSGGTVAGR